MKSPTRLSDISPARQALVRLCQSVNFGQIRSLLIQNADPCFEPPPQALIDVRLDLEEPPRPEILLADFNLPVEVCRLFDQLDQLKNGVIECIEVRAGIARRVIFRSGDWTHFKALSGVSAVADPKRGA